MTLSVDIGRQVPGFSLRVAFDVAPGQVAVLFGPSGAGKSMTLRIIAGLQRPDEGRLKRSGEVLFDGAAGVCVPAEERHAGYLFQDHVLFPHMTLIQNVMFGARGVSPEIARQRASEWMHTLRLEGLEDRLPSRVSGGQRQRAALARTIMSDPKTLLLDEPFSSLDSPTRAHLRKCLIGVIKRLNIPVVLVTHDLAEACLLGDKIVVMSGGRVLQIDAPKALLERPVNEEVQELVGVDT